MVSRSGGSWRPWRDCLLGALAVATVWTVALPAAAQTDPPSPSGSDAGQNSSDIGTSSTVRAPDAVESDQLAPLGPIESSQLPPAAGGEGVPAAGLGQGVWQGMTTADAQSLMQKMELPLRSPTMAALWRRLLLTEEEPAGGAAGQFLAQRLDGLYRAGLLKDAATLLAQPPQPADALQTAAGARVLLGLGDDAKACAAVKTIPLSGGPLKGRARNDALLMVAFCAARDKQPNHASLAAEVLRDQNFGEPLALAVLDSIAESKTPKLPRTDNLTLIDYKFMSLLGPVAAERFLPRATPDLVVAIANDASAEPAVRLAAGETAARLNAFADTDLATLYRTVQLKPQAMTDASDPGGAPQNAMRRAQLFRSAESEQDQGRRADFVRQLLATARRDGLLMPVARAAAPLVDGMRETADVGGFAEPAIETLLAAGKYDSAVGWTLFGGTSAGPGGNPLLHWMTLIDIADAQGHVPHGSSMKYAEDLAVAGALSPIMLQRLATVLEALQYEVPPPVAQSAQSAALTVSKSDQGLAPNAGLIARLRQAAQQKAVGPTVLLALATMGAGTATGVHATALGEAIKALLAAGLEADARRLAFEALFEAWPRKPGG